MRNFKIKKKMIHFPNEQLRKEWDEEIKMLEDTLIWGPCSDQPTAKPELGESRSHRELYLYNPKTGKLEGPEDDQRRIQQAFDELSQLVLFYMDEIMSRPITDPEKHQMLRQFRRNKRNKSRFIKNHFDTLKF